MAKPRKKLPQKTVLISCQKCKTGLLKYHKNGKGALVKCFVERIAADHTREQGVCPNCHSQFARPTMIRGTPALKIISGKVMVR